MYKQATGLTAVFSILMALTLGGIILHQLTGYHYPASEAFAYELNVIGDLYEAFILVPTGVVGLLALRKGSPWGPVLIGGVASTLAYNYAMVVTGRQNLWIFLWICKLALGGISLCLVWNLLPLGSAKPTRARPAISGYLAVLVVLFAALMGRRLWASAMGVVMEMSMQVTGPVDWAEPVVRDPVIFFAFAVPLFVTACAGLWLRADWGTRAASLAATFMVNMVIMILMTGPVKELLSLGALSPGMLPISLVFMVTAAPAVWALFWVTRGGREVRDGKGAA
ncbi:MAG TPA: hypothetical protein VD902_02180 [Symbiobacteriaceae bacterium]|nr:hypothetical protein [Symbiobacteriaceae bacterium]